MTETEVRSDASRGGLLRGARVYLSGPMDFVASRAEEKESGWRARVGQFLRDLGVTVFDPWSKPDVRGLHGFGVEDEKSTEAREEWTFEDSPAGAARRSAVTGRYWQTLHIDLRMVDTCDFVIAYCPTNIYSVGTPHEIALARSQRKPVLFVSPPVSFPALHALRAHLAKDAEGTRLLDQLAAQVPVRENPRGIPSLWYMPLVGGESFFDSFGFEAMRPRYPWPSGALDAAENGRALQRPLLPFLEKLDRELPKRWERSGGRYVDNDDWLLWDLHESRDAAVEGVAVAPEESP